MTEAAEWAGKVGETWADEWPRTDRAFAPLTERLVAAILEAAPESGRAFDIGCGAGETSLALAAARPGLDIVGADLSAELIEAARNRAGGTHRLRFRIGDAIALAGEEAPIDLFASRHGVMFFADPVAAFTAFRQAAAPGARMVFSCFRDWSLNGFACEVGFALGDGPPPAGAPGPFAFAFDTHVRAILAEAGWRDAAAVPVDFRYRVGAGEDPVGDAVHFLSRIGPGARALRLAAEADRPHLREKIREVCAARLRGGVVEFPAAAWLWSATAS